MSIEDTSYASRQGWGVGMLTRYVCSDKIGEGTYGQVFKAVDSVTGVPVALKKMTRHHEAEGFPRTETREIKILAGNSHTNMVLLREIVTSMSVKGVREVRDREAAARPADADVSFDKMGDIFRYSSTWTTTLRGCSSPTTCLTRGRSR
jgi:serine/threonine protein kinase